MTSNPAFPHAYPDGFRGVFRHDLNARALYSEGAGIARTMPLAVAVPEDSEDLGQLIRWARAEGLSLTPRGSGSGMAAGAVSSGVIVDLTRFSRLDQPDTGARTIRSQVGVSGGQVSKALNAAGLRMPVNPSSLPFCTIGGMASTNASGSRSLRFGSTRRWVEGLHCVFDDGSDAWIRRGKPLPEHIPAVKRLSALLEAAKSRLSENNSLKLSDLRHSGVRKDSSGYGLAEALTAEGHLVDLLVGSEGTLAFFTEVELAAIPIAGSIATVLATFASLEEATFCATETEATGASACELLDRSFLDVAARGGPTGVPAHAEAVLLIEIEGSSSDECRSNLERCAELCRKHGAIFVATASDPDKAESLWKLRHAASPILAALSPRLRSMQFIEDGCVPPHNFPAYVRGVREALSRFETPGVVFGHAGDAHAHVNPLVDTTRADWRVKARALLNTVVELTAKLGGTISGEHGDGRLRASLLPKIWSPVALAAFANVKSAADPTCLFNRGCKLLPGDTDLIPPEDDPFGEVRHDPRVPALPPEVRAILDEVERTRGWHRHRLDLLPGA